eukprot:3978735-Prymnesium_polylepis.1
MALRTPMLLRTLWRELARFLIRGSLLLWITPSPRKTLHFGQLSSGISAWSAPGFLSATEAWAERLPLPLV